MTYSNYQNWRENKINGKPFLSVVIPAYNESERIVPTIGAIASYICDLGYSWELIVSDDGSTDGMVAKLNQLQLANLRIISAHKNVGKGSAVRRGMLAARGDYVLMADADNATPINELRKLMQSVRNGADVAIASRAKAGANVGERSFSRKLMSATLQKIVQIGLGLSVEDTQCGFKLFTSSAVNTLCRLQTINGFAFDLELLYLASQNGMVIDEQPVRWFDMAGSKVNPVRDIQRFLRDIAQIRVNDLRGVYTRGMAPRPAVAMPQAVRTH